MSSPMSSGAGKKRETYCFTASICLWRTRGEVGNLRGLGPKQKGRKPPTHEEVLRPKSHANSWPHSNA